MSLLPWRVQAFLLPKVPGVSWLFLILVMSSHNLGCSEQWWPPSWEDLLALAFGLWGIHREQSPSHCTLLAYFTSAKFFTDLVYVLLPFYQKAFSGGFTASKHTWVEFAGRCAPGQPLGNCGVAALLTAPDSSSVRAWGFSL